MMQAAPSGNPSRRGLAGVALLASAAAAAAFYFSTPAPKSAKYSPNPAALIAFQKAYDGPDPSRAQAQAAIKFYEEAVVLDPAFATAWDRLSSARLFYTVYADVRALETMTLARTEAQKAAGLDPALAGPWRHLAVISHLLDWDRPAAESYFQKALALSPNDAVTLSRYAEFLLDSRRYEDGLPVAKRAQEAAPQWLEAKTVTGNLLAYSGQTGAAMEEFNRALAMNPKHGPTTHFLGRAYLCNGQFAKAIEHFRRSEELQGQLPFIAADLGYALAASGQRGEAREMLSLVLHERENDYYPAIAEIELGHAALDWLETADTERRLGYYLPSANPIYKKLSADSRFQALLAKLAK